MRPSTFLFLSACLLVDLAAGFLPPIPQARHRARPAPAARLSGVAMTSMYAEDLSKLTRLPRDEAIFILSLMYDDGVRRRTVASYLADGVKMERMALRPGASWGEDRSAFVREARGCLRRISSSVQDKEWERYVDLGGRKLHYKPTQLWACIDMTVQFSRVIGAIDEECRREADEAFQ